MAGETLEYIRGSMGSFRRGTTPEWWQRSYQAQVDPNSLSNWFYDPDQMMYVNKNEALGRSSRFNPANQGRGWASPYYTPALDEAALARQNINNLYAPVEVVKSPLLAGAIPDLYASWKAGSATATKGFDDYLNAFKTGNEAAYRAGNEAVAAVPGTINALTGSQRQYETDLRSAAQRYDDTLAASEATQRGIIARDYAALPEYQAALQAQNAVTQDALVRAAKGTRVGAGGLPMGSDMARVLARQSYEAALPYTMAGINRGYDIRGAERGVESGLTGQQIQYAGSFLPSTYSNIYTSGQNLATTVQNLKNQVSTMSYENAMRYMQSIGVPAQIQQAILSGQINNLGQIAALENQLYYRGLQYLPGQQITPVQNWYFNAPGYPTYDRQQPNPLVYNPTMGTGNGNRYGPLGNDVLNKGQAPPSKPNPSRTPTSYEASYNPEIYSPNPEFANPLFRYSLIPGKPNTYGWGPLPNAPTYEPTEGYDPYWYERSQALGY